MMSRHIENGILCTEVEVNGATEAGVIAAQVVERPWKKWRRRWSLKAAARS
jgi:hypothetical protein